MKIAIVTDDGQTISRHFGRARYYEVLDIEGGKVVGRERREKPGHHTFAQDGHVHGSEPHGFDKASEQKHTSMISPVQDCCVLVAGGMGAGAYQSILKAGLELYVVVEGNIDEAIEKLAHGTLAHHPEKLH
jgi:predicted Fe-Mo cluster-binding NifX family protein